MARFHLGRYDEAAELLEASLVLETARGAGGREAVLAALRGLYEIHLEQHDHAAAEDDAQRCLDLAREIYGPDDGRTAEDLWKLAQVRFLQQRMSEANELLDELREVDRLIREGQKPGREDTQRLLNRLTSTGLASMEMAERAQLLFDGGTPEAFFNVMGDISRASGRRIEVQLADRSEQLSQKLQGF